MLTTFIPQFLDIFMPLNESRPWKHPYHAEFFLNDETHFYLIRFIMYFNSLFTSEMIIANNTMFVIFTQHANGMFTILGYRVEQLFNDKQELSKSRFNCEKDYKNIAIFVEDHCNTLQFVDIIQSCYGMIIFLEFFGLLLVLGTTMVQVIKFNLLGMSDRPIRSVVYIGVQIFYMFMYSYMGQQLIDKSTQLSMKIYSSRWHSTVVWKQKMMIFIMLKCIRTITINVYNIFILRLENFSAVSEKEIDIKIMFFFY
ncbi:odorant receptor 7a isoform X2 [Monomorium pharaonis]|uniref:odorant receptor 7a isoform X2 n=1 Tax=Monomorium pharaonis TaxID=307658 RepID=UPI001746E697|nr:odorant receptor 7a isoform X2 [Monomorium pharaonis]